MFKSKFQAPCGQAWLQTSDYAIGHKMLRTLFFVKRREHYRDCATDYEALGTTQRCLAGSRR